MNGVDKVVLLQQVISDFSKSADLRGELVAMINAFLTFIASKYQPEPSLYLTGRYDNANCIDEEAENLKNWLFFEFIF